jgi:phosphonoacetaldehyde hydrolase
LALRKKHSAQEHDPLQLLNRNVPGALIPVRQLQAVVLDWAGTTVDFGSLAPVRTLTEVFSQAGFPITEPEARRDMGLPKKDHVRKILTSKLGGVAAEKDVEELYRRFIPLQLSCLDHYSVVIPGVPEAVERFRSRALKIGSTTGYTREMLDLLVAKSARSGYTADCNLTPEDAGAGRPAPFMIYSIAVRLKVYPAAAIVKVGDTPADIAEGLNAGVWCVGIAKTGNMVGLSREEFAALSPPVQQAYLKTARDQLAAAGAHYVVDCVGDLDPVLDDINARLRSRAS